MPHAAIALGSNLGDRHATLVAALHRISGLPTTSLTRSSPFIETAPVVPSGAERAGGPYLNAVAIVQTDLAPRVLLDALLTIERDLGRVRAPDNRWGPRTIDLDLLLYDQLILNEPGLVLPHPRLHLRRFVLDPLAHAAPHWVVPTLGRTAAELFIALPPPPVPPAGEPANNRA
jgi:2-amino-4-hydroxy-6-hydroxymethyldihydropteridine diphosphokinase